jgi:hypothetical protein
MNWNRPEDLIREGEENTTIKVERFVIINSEAIYSYFNNDIVVIPEIT